MLSLGYSDLGNDVNAMKSAQKFLEFSRKVENPLFEKNALNILGMINYRFDRNQEAIKAYQKALAIHTPEKVTGSEWGIYAGLGRVYRKLNQPKVAIGYYKKAISGIEKIRRGIEGLPPELQNSFLDTVVDFQGTKTADIYRELAELLISQGRQAEATQVLDLLKIQEIRDFAEANNNESIIALSRQISECEKTNCKQKSQLYDRREALLNEFNKDLDEIEQEIRDRIANDSGAFRPDSPKAAEIVNSQPGTVMIYPLVMKDKLWLLLYSGNAAKKFEVEVSRDKLGTTVKQFRKLMEECETRAYCGAEDIAKIKPVSEKLYSWLIKPLEGELKQNKVKNLVFALDRVTRYVPMSALYNGERYLIENYTIHNVLSADLTDTRTRLPENIKDTRVLAMGLSNAVGDFSALSNVPTEVDNIVRSSKTDKGVYPGKEYLNKSFDYKTLRNNLTGNNILHLATHGEFVPGREKASYLLLGNGEKLAIPKIQTLTGLSNIHLVVLSACQTALASSRQDGIEIASLAYSFMNKGAKSVIASLWQVADNSTSELMQNFYQNLAENKQNITKAEAMRLAQLQLLYNKEVAIDDIKRAGGVIVESKSPSSGKKSASKTFAHPYYWAPFVLIGNGL
ncbi:MAG: CHAT domain-containing protein [Rivularia sp. ALOHA_DT_140]|nr:CHAT domain-containing protein [Rivularia sp. ALOHA_DT_140]